MKMIQFLCSLKGKDLSLERASLSSNDGGRLMALYLREAGLADASCLVFLHGLWVSSAMWQPQLDRLSQDYHCLAPDLPEHGNSTDIGLLTLSNTSQVVANLIREKTPHGHAHIVGLSLGGLVALGLLRDVPEVIDHVLVSGCSTAARLGPIIAAASLLGKPLLSLLKPAPLLSLALRHSKIPQPYLSVLQEDLHHLQPEAILHFAAEFVKMQVPQGVKAPILVTVGQKEDVMMKRAARRLGRTLPAQAVMASGVGHIWNLEAPDLFTETVRAWMTDQPLPKELVSLADRHHEVQ
jgi:pimeloyl-ACP methyl ester carboxylesterase